MNHGKHRGGRTKRWKGHWTNMPNNSSNTIMERIERPITRDTIARNNMEQNNSNHSTNKTKVYGRKDQGKKGEIEN